MVSKNFGLYQIFALVLVCVVVIFAFSKKQETINIGVIGPLTGAASPYGTAQRNGVMLGMEDLKHSDFLKNRRINVIFKDDRNDKVFAAEVCRDLIYKDKVSMIIGAISSDNTMNIQRMCEIAGIPLLTAVSTNPFITRVNFRYSFRCLSDDNVQAEKLARHTSGEMNLKKVAILHDSNKYGSMGALTYEQKAVKLGQKIVAKREYKNGDMNFRQQLIGLKSANPDGLLIWGLVQESSLALRQAREMGWNIPVFGGDGMAPNSFLDLAGPAAEGVILTFPFNPAHGGSKTAKFTEDYRHKFKIKADSFAAHGYDAIMLAAQAVNASDGTPKSIRDSLSGIRNYVGVTGPGGFDDSGNETRPVELAQVRSGEFVPLSSGGLQ